MSTEQEYYEYVEAAKTNLIEAVNILVKVRTVKCTRSEVEALQREVVRDILTVVEEDNNEVEARDGFVTW